MVGRAAAGREEAADGAGDVAVEAEHVLDKLDIHNQITAIIYKSITFVYNILINLDLYGVTLILKVSQVSPV